MGLQNINYKLPALISKAVMSHTPLIIVEGEDDVYFYKSTSEHGKKRINVLASELIMKCDAKFYKPGCDGVIEIIKDSQDQINVNPNIKKFFLGIIDYDRRRYNNQDVDYRCLFKLKYYSYESHFISDDSTINLICQITSATCGDVTDAILSIVKQNLDSTINDLYYVALDSLKAICDNSYTAVASCDVKPETIYQDPQLIRNVLEKKEELDLFAKTKQINFDNDLKNIIKGKIYLYAYVKVIYEGIQQLKDLCYSNEIEQCDFCQINKFKENKKKYENCKWKIVNQLNRGEYVSRMIRININSESGIKYIRDRLFELGD